MSRRCEITGKGPLTGNNVSHAKNRTKRRFLPNLQRRGLFSDALGASVAFRLTVEGLRTVEKHGGLDAYLLATKDNRLTEAALRIKRRVESARASKGL